MSQYMHDLVKDYNPLSLLVSWNLKVEVDLDAQTMRSNCYILYTIIVW